VALPSGEVLALVRTPAEAHHVAASGRQVKVMALDEAARLIAKAEDLQTAILTAFPGATVKPATVLPDGYAEQWAHGNEAWFGNPMEAIHRGSKRTDHS
jgi:hypothetical protein